MEEFIKVKLQGMVGPILRDEHTTKFGVSVRNTISHGGEVMELPTLWYDVQSMNMWDTPKIQFGDHVLVEGGLMYKEVFNMAKRQRERQYYIVAVSVKIL